MIQRARPSNLTALLLAAAGLVVAQAPPQTYSLTEVFEFKEHDTETVTVYRDGDRAVLQNRARERQDRTFIDLSSNTSFTWNPADPADGCSRDEIPEAWTARPGPMNIPLEPFGTAAYFTELVNEKGKARQTGVAKINGISVNVLESLSDPQGKVRVWQDPITSLILKVEFALSDHEPERVIFEIKQFTVGKPPASEFALPASCTALPAPPRRPQPAPADPDFVNAQLPGPGISEECEIVLRVVQGDTMEPVTGFQIAVDLKIGSLEEYAKYAIDGAANGRATFSGGLREVTSLLRNGALRIDHAPELFGVGVHFINGGDASTFIFRQCFAPRTVLLMVMKNRDKPSEGIRWQWVRSGKFAQ